MTTGWTGPIGEDGEPDAFVVDKEGLKVSSPYLRIQLEILDVLERIQQQLAKQNEDENLEPGKRHYDHA